MPYEVFGVDLETPGGQDLFLEAYKLAKSEGFDGIIEDLTEPEIIDGFFQASQEAAKEFIIKCSNDASDALRYLAASEADRVFKVDPEAGISLMEKSLMDESEDVRDIKGYYKDILNGQLIDDFLEKAGLRGLVRILKAYKKSPSVDT